MSTEDDQRQRHAAISPTPERPSHIDAKADGRRRVQFSSTALSTLAVLGVLYGLYWARPLLAPILIGILISYALEPIVQRLVFWRVPHGLAASLVFAATIAAVAGLGYAVSHQVVALADRLPSAAFELREALQRRPSAPGPVAKLRQAANELQKLSGSDAPTNNTQQIPTVAIEKKPFDLGDYLWEGSLSVTAFIGEIVVVLFLALYLLLAGDLFRRRLIEIAGPTLSQKKITLQILDAIAAQIGRYLFIRAVISGIVAVGTFGAFVAIRLAQPAVWGVAAGLCNVVPYIGPIAVIAAAGVAAFLQFHSFSMAALAVALAGAVAFIEAYAISPWLMSRTAEMNPAAVFVGLLFWGWLWGLPGLFLAMPILIVVKSVSDHVEALQPVATLLKA